MSRTEALAYAASVCDQLLGPGGAEMEVDPPKRPYYSRPFFVGYPQGWVSPFDHYGEHDPHLKFARGSFGCS